MTITTIDALPAAPSRSDTPEDFITKADAFVAALLTLQTQLNAFAADIAAQATFTNYTATSVTSNAIAGTGTKTFAIQTGKLYSIGQFVIAADSSNPANYMTGQVSAHDPVAGSLSIAVTGSGGSGTKTAWTISLNLSAGSYLTKTGDTATGKINFLASALTAAGVNLGIGVDLTSGQVNGDIWISTALKFRIGGATLQAATLSGTETLAAKTLTLPKINDGSADNQYIFAVSELAANRTITLPLLAADDTFVFAAFAQTLTNKTLTGIANGSTIKDTAGTAYNIGKEGLPPVTATGAHTFVASDVDKSVDNTTGGWVIDSNANLALPIGSLLSGYNNSGSSQNLSITSDTLRYGTSGTGTRAIAGRGSFTCRKVNTTEWVVLGGQGIS